MCGIAGIFVADAAPIAAGLIRTMAQTLSHRGPDGSGVHCEKHIGLGHRRLSIIDLTDAAAQPMTDAQEQFWMVYNGELYNYRELRTQLAALGYRFRSNSDTEVVLHAYQAWRENCLEQFNGHFAFAIWESKRQKLFMARDRYGVKPLYYHWNGSRLIFSSEVKAMLTVPGVPRQVNLAALNEYFTFQNLLTDQTLFEGIQLLPAGETLTISVSDPTPRTRRYWDFHFPDAGDSSAKPPDEKELMHLFEQAVKRQLIGEVPLGAYLSGGMDSGSIVSVASRQIGGLNTFTIGFDPEPTESPNDERALAKALADHFRTQHAEVTLHPKDMEAVMPELIWHLEDLRVGQCYPNYYAARLAGQSVKVVLSGVGGDELFAGYPWRYPAKAQSWSLSQFESDYYDFWQRLVPDKAKAGFFQPPVLAAIRGESSFERFRSTLKTAGRTPGTLEEATNNVLRFELKTFLHGLLIVEDKLSMAYGLETRAPFLDNDLVNYALAIPAASKLTFQLGAEGQGKQILRQAMRGLLPAGVTEKKKQGFSAPDAAWFRNQNAPYIRDLLLGTDSHLTDYLNPDALNRILSEHRTGQHNHRLLIWSLISFAWWLKIFIHSPQRLSEAVKEWETVQ